MSESKLERYIKIFDYQNAHTLSWAEQDEVRDLLRQLKQIQDNAKCPQTGNSPP